MKRPRRSAAISLFVALAVVGAFVVAIAGCSGLNDGAAASASEGAAASQVKDDNLKTLNVGSDLYPPFVYSNEYGDIVGLDVDILTEALGRIGYKPKYQLIDWEKKKELLASGELDCVMGSFSMTGREGEYRWAGPYLASRQVVAVDPESDIYTLADLEGRVVAVQSTTKPESILLNHTNENVPQMGVRTESWTAGRSGLEVRMYSREKVELFLLATEDGMGPTAAAEFAGVSVGAAKKWATGHLPHSYTGARCRIVARKPPRKEASLGPDKSIYAPPATGPLAGLNEDQIENLLLRAVLADLKAEGWDPASISNRSKCELGERLRRATALPLRSITGFLRISKSSYEYWRPRVAVPRDRDADIRDRVVRIFREGSGCWGYRTVWARLRREGVRASEKRVARVMREEGLEVVYNKRRARGYSSYAGEVSKAPENLVNRNFHADEPNRLWLTDITEFRLPGGEKVYLSPVIDCFDGMPVAWSIGLHPDKRLANSSLLKACAARPSGARTTIHSDRGGHYRWPEWIGICEENGLVRSMSAKGCSPDNSACEGFFGRLKNEFFRYRDWEGVTAEEFMGRLEAYLVYYRDGRIKKSLGWLSPMEYRRKLGYA